jgi:hypothetical protein
MGARVDNRTTRSVVVAAAAFAFALIACSAPVSVDGTPYGNSSSSSNGDDTKKPAKKRNTTPAPVNDAEDPTADPTQGTASRPSPVSAPTETDPTPTTPAPTATTPPAATAPPPPPSCQSSNPDTCFNCCLNANPGAIPLENAYDSCLNNAFSDADVSNCANQHAAQCNGSTDCRSHHACLQANGCLGADS